MVFTVKCLGGEFIKRILKNIMSHASLKLEKNYGLFFEKIEQNCTFSEIAINQFIFW